MMKRVGGREGSDQDRREVQVEGWSGKNRREVTMRGRERKERDRVSRK